MASKTSKIIADLRKVKDWSQTDQNWLPTAVYPGR